MISDTLAEPTELLSEFDDIRPYYDDELQGKIAELVRDPALIRTVGFFMIPRIYQLFPSFVGWLISKFLTQRYRNIRTRDQLQDLLGEYVAYVIRESTAGFSLSGIEHIPKDSPCIFMSNHRDIVLDPAFIVYTVANHGIKRPQLAVGDNLLTYRFARDVMRMNRSFMVIRSAGSARQQYEALVKTSKYIRHTLEQGESVWISQRQGRSKDGLDRTDPAVLKMVMLAYRKEFRDYETWLERIKLIPATVSYELDPCAPRKARELYVRATTGTYQKQDKEDLHSIVDGVKGFKGRVHLEFSSRIENQTDSTGTRLTEDSLAHRIDQAIARGAQQFPVFVEAQRLLNGGVGCELEHGKVRRNFEAQLASLTVHEQKFLLLQYANQLHKFGATQLPQT